MYSITLPAARVTNPMWVIVHPDTPRIRLGEADAGSEASQRVACGSIPVTGPAATCVVKDDGLGLRVSASWAGHASRSEHAVWIASADSANSAHRVGSVTIRPPGVWDFVEDVGLGHAGKKRWVVVAATDPDGAPRPSAAVTAPVTCPQVPQVTGLTAACAVTADRSSATVTATWSNPDARTHWVWLSAADSGADVHRVSDRYWRPPHLNQTTRVLTGENLRRTLWVVVAPYGDTTGAADATAGVVCEGLSDDTSEAAVSGLAATCTVAGDGASATVTASWEGPDNRNWHGVWLASTDSADTEHRVGRLTWRLPGATTWSRTITQPDLRETLWIVIAAQVRGNLDTDNAATTRTTCDLNQ